MVGEGLFALDPPTLLSGRCRDCAQSSFPAASCCPYCRGADVDVVPLPTVGTIYSYTISRITAPGYCGPVPYGYGIVEFDTGIRVATLLNADPIEELKIGALVRFALVDVGTAGDPLLSYTYKLEQ
jgi:uncharacterized OB-fold protein